MKESEEDTLLMKQAQSKARVTRVIRQPSIIQGGTMRDYQLEGLNWMIKLHDNGINGILADEMGLGKTLQSISLLAFLRETRGIHGPHIIIVPKSTVGNWMREFRRWCPTINAVKLLGDKEERKRVCTTIIGPLKFDVLVTSYECILREKATLVKVNWKYLMIDEAHRIKNENSSLSTQVRLMNTQFRLLITGTPLQNNLHELWALLNFLLPDVFGNSEDFDKWFSVTGDSTAQDNVIRRLHTVLRPFMLRRVKADVEKNLPPKVETKLYIGLTKMQRQWYKRILNKDAPALNALGGPDRVRLLNVLMQLRKVCNHPYLFDGAEPGPPYINGPHLWENTGKMVLLHKLLPKLKEQGSRVLIFSQMTRLLDILEDYMHIQGHQYCRIDGNTDGDLRDSQMTEFNREGSPKFIFLLSTRAGGLGINLQTADTVVLYDSDWNPQADLQAMDRAHRIGQTKTVKVFRFISEGTVEEKIVERADRKLFLDAAVIQQGRLAEKHSQLSKNELMTMVKFGAENILHADDLEELSDEHIDALLERGQKRTEEIKSKIETDMKHSLANFSLVGDEEANLFAFEGEDYKNKSAPTSVIINLPQRERKRTYGTEVKPLKPSGSKDKKKKGPTMHDFQFFNRARLTALFAKEQDLAERRSTNAALVKDLRSRAKKGVLEGDQTLEDMEAEITQLEDDMERMELSSKEQAEKQRLLSDAFADWNRKDLRSFVAAMERHGRDDMGAIKKDVSIETGKSEDDIARYHKVFWQRHTELADSAKILDRIQKGERKIQRGGEIRAAIEKKVARYSNPMQTLALSYGGNRGKVFTEDEDSFLVNMMHKHGYGNWEVIRMEIRQAWQFRFDWFFKSRNSLELQRRADTLVRFIERENDDLDKKKAKRKAAPAPAAPVVVAAASASGGGKKRDRKRSRR